MISRGFIDAGLIRKRRWYGPCTVRLRRVKRNGQGVMSVSMTQDGRDYRADGCWGRFLSLLILRCQSAGELGFIALWSGQGHSSLGGRCRQDGTACPSRLIRRIRSQPMASGRQCDLETQLGICRICCDQSREGIQASAILFRCSSAAQAPAPPGHRRPVRALDGEHRATGRVRNFSSHLKPSRAAYRRVHTARRPIRPRPIRVWSA